MCVGFCNVYYTYIFCASFVYLFLLVCSYFVVLCNFYCIVCTSVGLLLPGESPIAVSEWVSEWVSNNNNTNSYNNNNTNSYNSNNNNNNSNNNNNNNFDVGVKLV